MLIVSNCTGVSLPRARCRRRSRDGVGGCTWFQSRPRLPDGVLRGFPTAWCSERSFVTGRKNFPWQRCHHMPRPGPWTRSGRYFLVTATPFLARFCLPRSLCRIVPSGIRIVIALRIAQTTSEANMCESMEYPTMLLDEQSFLNAEVGVYFSFTHSPDGE